MKQYRIGDFARCLGVTADFLKHYENAGLIDVRQHDNGYRYYPFDQSARIIEYLRLRNYGVTVKEMGDFLTGNAEEAVTLLDDKTAALEAEVRRMNAVIEAHRRLKRWYEKRQQRPIDWEIRETEPWVFLPHSDHQDFRRDKGLFELLKTWGMWLPVTKSALAVDVGMTEDTGVVHWGFAVQAALAEKYGLPVNEVVQTLTFGKAFVYHFVGLEGAFNMADAAAGRHPAFLKMKALGLTSAGTGLLINEMRLTDAEGHAAGGVGRFIIPIRQ